MRHIYIQEGKKIKRKEGREGRQAGKEGKEGRKGRQVGKVGRLAGSPEEGGAGLPVPLRDRAALGRSLVGPPTTSARAPGCASRSTTTSAKGDRWN